MKALKEIRANLDTAIKNARESSSIYAAKEQLEVVSVDLHSYTALSLYLSGSSHNDNLFHVPLASFVKPWTSELDDYQIWRIADAVFLQVPYVEGRDLNTSKWSRAKTVQAMYEIAGVKSDTALLIPAYHSEAIDAVASGIWKVLPSGTDDSIEAMIEIFEEMLKKLSVKSIPFPMPDLESNISYLYME